MSPVAYPLPRRQRLITTFNVCNTLDRLLKLATATQTHTTAPKSITTAIMALITSKTLITSISLFHITLGFFFLTNPSAINDQILVQVLGQSMGIVSNQLSSTASLSLTLSSHSHEDSTHNPTPSPSSPSSSYSLASATSSPWACPKN